MPAAVYNGTFSREQAERLLWRAGFGPRRGEAASLAKLGLEGAVRKLTRPGGERFVGAAPHDDKGRGARSGGRLGTRPHLVARPDGAHVAPARRADDPRLARLVRDLARRRRLAEADAEPEQAHAQTLAGLVRDDAARRHARPGDAALALRNREHEVVAERELRPRADGALHARGRAVATASATCGSRPAR